MNKILISIRSSNNYYVILKIRNYHLPYSKLIEKRFIFLQINKQDLKHYEQIFNNEEIKIVKEYGFHGLLNYIKRKLISLIALSFFIILYLASNCFIINIEINTSNLNLKKYLKYELSEHGIKPLTYMKNYDELQKIKSDILNDNKEKLEWLEIRREGIKYTVDVLERIDVYEKKQKPYCHIVASKDAMVKRVIYDKGLLVVKENDLVKKGDLLISGDILNGEVVTSKECANGSVLGEVWYQVNVRVPLSETIKKETGKWRYNMSYYFNDNERLIFRSRVSISEPETIKQIGINKWGLKIIKEKEVSYKNYVLKEEEALQKALNKGIDAIKIKLSAKEQIISEKVLKKRLNNSTMDVEIFIVTLEDIGTIYIPNEE